MKTKSFLFSATIICLFFAYACRPAAAPVSISNKPVSINDVRQPYIPSKPVQQMSWKTADGVTQTLMDFPGKVVILDFWATYCPPCRKQTPYLNSLLAKYGAENLQIIGLNVGGDEDRQRIPAYIQTTNIDYTIAFPEEELTRFIFAERDEIPQTAIFDRKGRLVKKAVGFNDEIKKELDLTVESVFKSD